MLSHYDRGVQLQESEAATAERSAAETERAEAQVERQINSSERQRSKSFDEQQLTGTGREKKEALEALSPGSFSEKHDAFVAARVEDTGQWLLQTHEFREWVTMKGDPLLFCPGIGRRFYAMLLMYDKAEQESRL
jgi:hypothetical protein